MHVYRNKDNEVEVIDVVGGAPDREYGKPDGAKIRGEVMPALRDRQLDPEKSVLLLFCNLMDYDPQGGTISHHSPYYGGGTYLQGNAWQCDSEILDPLRLEDRTPIRDGEYGQITIGMHNSIFIGGVIHELGHALSLPHCCEREDQRVCGTALMGSGNRTFGQQLRGEGLGTFLTQAHAVRLAAHPVFNQQVTTTLYDLPTVTWKGLDCSVSEDRQIHVHGTVVGKVPIHGVVAYFDSAGGGDYDATTAVAIPNDEGEFMLESGLLRPSLAGELRLVTCHVNGSTDTRVLTYRVDDQGNPDLSTIDLVLKLGSMLDALRQGDIAKAEAELKSIAAGNDSLQVSGRRVLDRFQQGWSIDPPVQRNLSDVPQQTDSISLSHVQPATEKVGWIRPTYDAVPEAERILSLDGDYFASGIYAHAPAQHEYSLQCKWSKLRGRCGIQTGHFGKVDFEILGDGKSLWKKRGITDGSSVEFEVDLFGIEQLTLLVRDGDDGSNGDWGVWIEPTLSR